MLSHFSRAVLASALLLGLSAFQGKSKLALDRPYSHSFRDADTFTRDLADIKKEHSLDELHWKHLRAYPTIAVSSNYSQKLPSTGITYRQASQLVEKYFFSAKAQRELKEANKNIPEAPPLY